MEKKQLMWSIVVLVLVVTSIVYVIMRDDMSREGEAEATSSQEEGSSFALDMVDERGAYSVEVADVAYFGNVSGYFARPSGTESFPGVVMIHEWWGLNENIKTMAETLASHGYQVLAVDLYDGEVADTPERARELRTSLNQETATANLSAATKFLRERTATRVASLGWCFGGGQSLELALSGEELDATVIYYGSLTNDSMRLGAIEWPVLGIFGEEDTSISVEDVRAFEDALNELEINNDIYIYPGVGHAFANPSGDNYAPEPTRDAWDKTLSFLETHLK